MFQLKDIYGKLQDPGQSNNDEAPFNQKVFDGQYTVQTHQSKNVR